MNDTVFGLFIGIGIGAILIGLVQLARIYMERKWPTDDR